MNKTLDLLEPEIESSINGAQESALNSKARAGIQQAIGTQPDQFAESLQISEKTQLPLDVVERNKEAAKKKAALQSLNIEQVLADAPEARQWLSDPVNSKLVSDDFSMIGRAKKIFSDIPKAVESSSDMLKLQDVRYRQMFGDITPEEAAQAEALSTSLDGKTFGTGGFVSDALTETARNTYQLASLFGAQVEGGVTGGAVGAAAGAGAALSANVIPPLAVLPEEAVTVPAAAIALGSRGAIAGSRAYGWYENFRQQSSMIFDDMLKIRGEDGARIDFDTARGAAIVAGAPSALLDYIAYGKLLDTVPGADFIKGKLNREGVRELVKMPGMKEAFKRIGVRFAKGVTVEGLTEGAQEAIQIVAEEAAKASAEGNFTSQKFSEAASRVGQSAYTGALVGGVIGGAGSGLSLGMEYRRQRQASPDQVTAHVQQINQGVRENVLFQRNPERFRSLVESLAGDERMYAPYDVVAQVVEGMEPAQRDALFSAAPDLKVELETAAETNADIALRKADYISYIAPYPQADLLVQHIKLDPADMSVAERAEYQQFLTQNPEAATAMMGEVSALPPAAPQETQNAIERIVRKALSEAGRGGVEARSLAPLFARSLSRFAAPFGQSATEYLNRGLLQFETQDEQGNALKKGSNFSVLLNDLQAVREGKRISNDEQVIAAVNDFGRRLDEAGIAPEQAQQMDTRALLDAIYKPQAVTVNDQTITMPTVEMSVLDSFADEAENSSNPEEKLALRVASGGIATEENQLNSLLWALANNRPDIVDAIISRKKREASAASVARPGLSKENSKYAEAEASLQKRAQEAAILAEQFENLARLNNHDVGQRHLDRSNGGVNIQVAPDDTAQNRGIIEKRLEQAEIEGSFSPEDEGILFQGEQKELLVQHNLTEANLLHAQKLGGIPVPSLAVTKKDSPLTNFGEITLLGSREMADPKGYAATKVFGADVYSPRYPSVEYSVSQKAVNKLDEQIAPYQKKYGGSSFYDPNQLKEGARELENNTAFLAMFLDYQGVAVEPSVDEAGKPVDWKTRSTMREIIESQGLRGKLNAYIAEKLNEMGAKERIFRGYTHSGNRRYIEHNLDNVVKILKKELRGGEGFNYGVGSLRAKFTPQFKSIEQIRKAKDRLITGEQFEKVKAEIDAEFFALADTLKPFYKYDANKFGYYDTVTNVFGDAAKQGLPSALREYGFENVAPENMTQAAEFLSKLRELPTEYFEAKILREVDLAEFKGAVVPDDIGEAAMSALKGRGITDIKTYKRGDDADRAAKIAEFENLFFQGERGSITLGTDMEGELRRVVIAFKESANFSTGAHEFSHWAVAQHRIFARMARAEIAAGNNNAEIARIADDWETLKKEVGAESDDFTVEQEEKVASMFEGYLRKGEAPSEGLRRIFTRFRDWLTKIYKDITGLGMEVSPEIAGVFDRWLASEEEIAKVREKNSSLAEIAMKAGLPDNIVERIADYMNSATAQAEETLYRALDREQRARETQAYKGEFDRVRAEVEKEFLERREYNLIQYLRENNLRVYIDPVADKDLVGIAPEFDSAPEDAAPLSLEDLQAFNDEQMEVQAARNFAIDVLLNQKKPRKPLGLSSFLVKKGGIKEDGGELKNLGLSNKKRPGLISKNGLQFDYAREAAIEAGYLPEDAGINDLLAALESEARGVEVYSSKDAGEVAEFEAYENAYDKASEIAADQGINIESERNLRKSYSRYSDITTDNISAVGAVHPDAIADLYGYDSGITMLRALKATPDFDRAVNAETRKRLMDKYPDMIVQKRISGKATDAIINDRVLLALDLLIKEMGKSVSGERVGMKQFAKVMAQEQVSKMKMSEVNYAFRYEAAREKSMREALKAARAGDNTAALLNLQRAMVNQTVYKSLVEFSDVREKADALFKRVDEKDKDLAPRADIDFIGAARFLLNKYGLGGEAFDINPWLADMREREPEIMADLMQMSQMVDAPPKPAKDLTIAEFLDIYNSVQNIFWVARKMKEFQLADKKVNNKLIVESLLEGLAKIEAPKPIEGTQVRGGARVRATLMGLKAVQRRVEHWARSMDEGKDGSFTKYLWQPISKAATEYRLARSKWMKDLNTILNDHKDILRKPGKISVPEMVKNVDGQRVPMVFNDKQELIGFLLHTGNMSNLEKLLGGYGIDQTQYEVAIQQMQRDGRITKEDMRLVQKLWDFAEDLKPISQNAHKKLFGYRFEEIESMPVKTPFGVFRGGYWPAVVDYEQVDSKNIEQAISDTRQFMLASTNKGFTKSRVKAYRKQLSTNLRLASSHVDSVLKFAYLEPAVRDVSRIVNNQDFKDALKARDPAAYSDMLMPWLQRAARQNTVAPGAPGSKADPFKAKVFRHMRVSASAQTMMGNLSNALQNITGFTVSGREVGMRNLGKAFAEYMANPLAAGREVQSLSKVMQTRQNVIDVDVSNEINDIIMRRGYFTKVKNAAMKHGYIFQRIMQGFVDNVTWKAAFTKAVSEGKSDADAVDYADSVVRRTQSSLNPEDISKIEAGSEGEKLFLMFYSYFNNIANLAGTEARVIMRDMGWAGTPKLFYLYVMLAAIPAFMADMIAQGLRGNLPGDDDDDGIILDDWLAFFAGGQARYAAATVPYAGQALNSFMNFANKKPYDDRLSTSPALGQIETTMRFMARELGMANPYTDASNEVRDGLNAIGFITGLPLGQAGKPVGFLVNVNEGDEPAAGYVRGLVGGPSAKK